MAKINTEGTRVADVFYVTEADGKKLESGGRTQEVHNSLLATLGVVRAVPLGAPASDRP